VSSRDVDGRSDQFALGVILYECATGRRPFEGETFFTILMAIAEGAYARPREVRPELSERFEVMLMRSLRVAPDARFPSVTALADELRACASQAVLPMVMPAATPALVPAVSLAETVAARRAPVATVVLASAAMASTGERRSGRWIGLALGALVLLGLIAGAATRGSGDDDATPAQTAVAAPFEAPAAGATDTPRQAARAASAPAADASERTVVAPHRGRGHGRGHGHGHPRGRRRHDD